MPVYGDGNYTRDWLYVIDHALAIDLVFHNGDNKQTDIFRDSGLDFCIERLSKVEGVGISKLEYHDIQRNGIIGAVLYALES